MIRTGEGTAAASEALTIQGGKVRGGCADDLKGLLTGEWQESAGIKGKLLAVGLRPRHDQPGGFGIGD